MRYYPKFTICHNYPMISFPSKIVQGIPWLKTQYLLHEADLIHSVSKRLRHWSVG